ncbi:MAG TPA: hypothetical protein EYP43_01530 [Thermoplasmata archaeon]|nr:hypothetical protein [Thermoplasmata archaeon]
MVVGSLLRVDIEVTWRLLNDRMRKHVFLSGIIILAVLGFTALIIRGVLFVMEGQMNSVIERWEAVLIIFGILLSRSIMYTYNRFLRARELQSVMSSPITPREVMENRLLLNAILLGTLFGLALGLVWASVVMAGWSGIGPGGLGPGILAEAVTLYLLALFLGFSIPIKLQVRPVRRAFVHLVPEMYIGVLIYLIAVLSGNALEPTPVSVALLVLLVPLSLESVLLTTPSVGDAWARQTMKMGSSRPMRDPVILPKVARRLWGRRLSTLVAKELKIAVREREFVGNLLVTVSIAALLLITYVFFPLQAVVPSDGGDSGDLTEEELARQREAHQERQKYIYPLLIGFAIFINALLLGALTSLAMVGVEGKALWNIKALPILSREVMWAKAMAVFLVAWPVVMATALAVPIIGRFPLEVTVFFFVEGNAFLLSFIGLGIFGAATFPNFAEMERGMPDLLIQILMVIAAFIVSLFIGAVPAYLLNADYLYGLTASVTALIAGILLFEWGVGSGSRRLEVIDAEAYGGAGI